MREIGAARAALFPRITLTGLLGLASTSLAGLFSGGAFQWSPGSDVTYTIFQGGAGRANVRLTEAQRDAAVAEYQRTIQQAFREVADALARRGTIGEQLRARQSQREAAADTYLSDRSALSERHRQLPRQPRRATFLLFGAAHPGA